MQHGWQTVDRIEPVGERGMVATKNRLASEAGAKMFLLNGAMRWRTRRSQQRSSAAWSSR